MQVIPFPFDERPGGPVSTFPAALALNHDGPDGTLVSLGGVIDGVRHLATPGMLIPGIMGAALAYVGKRYLPKKYRKHAAPLGAVVGAGLAHARMTMQARGETMAGWGASSMPTLRLGASGGSVKKLQALLMPAIHPSLSAASLGDEAHTGTFGAATDAYVKTYQKKAGLGVDGVVGPKTWSSLLGVKVGGGRRSPAAPAGPAAPGAAPGLPPTQQTPEWLIPVVLGVGSLVLLGVTAKIVGGRRR